LYARGVLNEYAAGWESTFLDAAQVHALLSFLFAPALAVFPLQGFSLADVQALRFVQEPSPAGGARWVHLYAATLLLLVVLPRLVLARIRPARAPHRPQLPARPRQQPYFRLLADQIGAGTPAVLRVIPYSFTVDEARHKGLVGVAAMVLGDQAQLMLRPSAPYGEEPKDACAMRAWTMPTSPSRPCCSTSPPRPSAKTTAPSSTTWRSRRRAASPCCSTNRAWSNAAPARPVSSAPGRTRRAVAPVLPVPPHQPPTVVDLLHPARYPLELRQRPGDVGAR
jgi:hypothetical protein